MSGDPHPQRNKADKPPRKFWEAAHPFIDLRLSHIVTVFLTAGLLFVALAQAIVYIRQAHIMKAQADIASRQWQVMQDQLAEMRASGQQTDRTIAALTDQGKTMRDQVTAIEAGQRPLVGLDDDTPAFGLQTGDIIFDERGDARVSHAEIAKNFSQSAANAVAPFADLLVTEDVEAIDATRTQSSKASYPPEFGRVLFSGKSKFAIATIRIFRHKDMVSKSENGKVVIWMEDVLFTLINTERDLAQTLNLICGMVTSEFVLFLPTTRKSAAHGDCSRSPQKNSKPAITATTARTARHSRPARGRVRLNTKRVS
jgi:hypothetical protein